MIVEFIGASGSGKTSLAGRVAERLGGDARLAWDLMLKPPLDGIRHPTARNVWCEVLTLPDLILSRRRNREFIHFAIRKLNTGARSTFEKWNYRRSILRKLGMHERSRRQRGIVLADEGTVLSAYYLFVYSRDPIRQVEVERFAVLVPLPDRIVYVKAPLETLTKRAQERADRRRELAGSTSTERTYWLGRAVDTFDLLVEAEPIRERTLIVDSVDHHGNELTLDRVVNFVTASRRAHDADRSGAP